MLKSLYKYEFRWMFFKVLIVWALMLGLATLGYLIQLNSEIFADRISEIPVLFTMSIISKTAIDSFLNIAISMSFTFCLVLGAVRFYRNIYSSEGYFTLCTPISPAAHVLCKFVVTVVYIFATACVAMLAIVIRNVGNIGEYLNGIIEAVKNWVLTTDSVLLIFEMILAGLALIAFSVFKCYLAVSFGQCIRNRVFGAVLFYFIIDFAIEMLVIVAMCVWVIFVVNSNIGNEMVMIHSLMWCVILGTSGLAVGSACIVISRLKHRLNLE